MIVLYISLFIGILFYIIYRLVKDIIFILRTFGTLSENIIKVDNNFLSAECVDLFAILRTYNNRMIENYGPVVEMLKKRNETI